MIPRALRKAIACQTCALASVYIASGRVRRTTQLLQYATMLLVEPDGGLWPSGSHVLELGKIAPPAGKRRRAVVAGPLARG